MRDSFKAVSLAAEILLIGTGLTTTVRAADLPVFEAPEPLPINTASSGWYLRGDIGYKSYVNPKGSMSNPDWGTGCVKDSSGACTSYNAIGTGPYRSDNHDQMIDENMLGAGDFGIGVGYQFNDYLRADLTLDYETPAKFNGTMWCASADAAQCQHSDNTGGYDDPSMKIAAWSALANVYADLADFNGLKPYVGAGIGVSNLRTSDVSAPGFEGTDGSKMHGASTWNFAWALMAGVSYPITDRLSADLGYRYINLGDAKTSSILDTDSGPSQPLHFNVKDIAAHEVRLGLRYTLF